MRKSQLVTGLNATVLVSSGKQTLETYKNPSRNYLTEYVITDSFTTDYVILYENGTWASDGIFYHINRPIKKYLDKLAKLNSKDN